MPREIRPKLTVAELLARAPSAAIAFVRHRMACVGCAMAPFDTLDEAAAVYGLDLPAFLNEVGALGTGAARDLRRRSAGVGRREEPDTGKGRQADGPDSDVEA